MTIRAIIATAPSAVPEPLPSGIRGFFAKMLGGRPELALRGVYLHNAGEPSEVGPLLFNVVNARHGGRVAEAARELVDENPAGWSSLFFFADEAQARAWDGKTKLTVDQHQDYFNRDAPEPGPTSYAGDPMRDLGFTRPPIGPRTDKMGAVFVYTLFPDALGMYLVGEDGVSMAPFAQMAWNEAAPDWDAADAAARRASGMDDDDD